MTEYGFAHSRRISLPSDTVREKKEARKKLLEAVLQRRREIYKRFMEKNAACRRMGICYNHSSMGKYITSTPDIMGGAPVIKGTRIPMEVILHRLKEGYPIEAIHAMYEWVDIKTLEGA